MVRIGRPGSDRLSRALRRSTIGAEGFHGRVRDGIGCLPLAIATRSSDPDRPAARELARWDGCGVCDDGGRPQPPFVLRMDNGEAPSWRGSQAERAISTGQLRVLPHVHTRPIDVVVFHGSSGRPRFEAGFPLRCFQRLSLPYIATRLCRWRDNRSTRGTSIPVLSY